MGQDKRCARFQPASYLAKHTAPLVNSHKVQSQEASCTVKRPNLGILHVALEQICPRTQRAKRCTRKGEHFVRRVDSFKCPFRMCLRKSLDLETSASSHYKHPSILGKKFCEKDVGHAHHVSPARHHAGWSVRVCGYGLGIGEDGIRLLRRSERGNR